MVSCHSSQGMTEKVAVEENVVLALLTTLQVGGAARFLVDARTEDDIISALNFARARNLPVFILGGGSNLLVSDAGFNGLVLKISLQGIEFRQTETDILVTAAAGEDWDGLVETCVERKLAGIECLSGIPGTVGATPVQNVGAYGQEVTETIVSVRVFDRVDSKIKNLTNAECGFAYRTSVFNTSAKNRFVVLNVTFKLKPNGAGAIVYADLQHFFAEKPDRSLREVRAAVLQIRAAKSMIIMPTDENRRSAGSFFKNPIVDRMQFAAIQATTRRLELIVLSEDVPHFSAGDERFKIPAAWLIEKSGFNKGFVSGRVGISTKHTLALINRGGATAGEIASLAAEIQTQVKKVFGVELQPEPIRLGFD